MNADLRMLAAHAVKLHRSGDLQAAWHAYQQILQLHPTEAAAHYGLGLICEQTGRPAEAVAHFRQAVTFSPSQSEYLNRLSGVLLLSAKFDEALTAAEQAVELNPANAQGHNLVGRSLERLHRLNEAVAAAERSLQLDPNDPFSLWLMARIKRRGGELPEAYGRLKGLVLSNTMPDRLVSQVWHELGLVCDRLGRFEEAFDAFDRAGRAKLSQPSVERVDSNRYPQMIAAYRNQLNPALFAAAATRAEQLAGPAPAFLVGMPRSGTTLTEQILAAHPQIQTTDELMLLAEVEEEAARIAGGEGQIPDLAALTFSHVQHLRDTYWHAVREKLGAVDDDVMLVDKLPLNLTRVALINTVFPDARLLVALRDPRDTCLSCFMQDFRPNEAMVHFLTLEDTVAFYDLVMGFWLEARQLLTVQYLEVKYRDTVSSLESQAARMLEFLGLEWDDNVLNFHEQARQRNISTPSYEAVTQKVHTDAVDRWRNYEVHFEPFQQRLAPYITAFCGE